MPRYLFACKECGEYKEVEWKIAEYEDRKDKVLCPRCGSLMHRKYTQNFSFKDKDGHFFGKSSS